MWLFFYEPLAKSSVFFQCHRGWYGTDCSIPSVLSSVREWPRWLRPAHVEVPDDMHLSGSLVNLDAVVKKKRPLIYVYDLPPEFNSLLLEVRMGTTCDFLSHSLSNLFMFFHHFIGYCRGGILSLSV